MTGQPCPIGHGTPTAYFLLTGFFRDRPPILVAIHWAIPSNNLNLARAHSNLDNG
ncbi:MAG: hypothetical protein NTNFB01_11070 [Nitrospira sp.]